MDYTVPGARLAGDVAAKAGKEQNARQAPKPSAPATSPRARCTEVGQSRNGRLGCGLQTAIISHTEAQLEVIHDRARANTGRGQTAPQKVPVARFGGKLAACQVGRAGGKKVQTAKAVFNQGNDFHDGSPYRPTQVRWRTTIRKSIRRRKSDEGRTANALGADVSNFTGQRIKVAVLDTGIDATHQAFQGLTLNTRNFTTDVDHDGNGHGTHCAGTIFGRTVEGQRIGVAPGVTTAFIRKVIASDGSGTSLSIFDGLDWAISSGANIISLSLEFDFSGQVDKKVGLGWPTDLAVSDALVAYRQNLMMFEAIMAKARVRAPFRTQPLVIAAAGNESKRGIDPNYRIATSLPAASTDLAVAAVAKDDMNFVVANFSNGDSHIAAPGVDIVSAWPGGGLRSLSGTSMACPHVAGVAALWMEADKQSSGNGSADIAKSNMLSRALRTQFKGAHKRADHGNGMVVAP